MTNLRKYAGPEVPAVILTNKFDLVEEDLKSVLNAHKELAGLGCKILSASDKTGHNVEKAFEILVDAMLTDDWFSPDKKEDPVSMPKKFTNVHSLLDYMMMRFCAAMGDQEMGMYIFRKQFSDKEIDFYNITKDSAKRIIEPLVKIISEVMGAKIAKELQQDLMRAHSRCK